MPPHGDTTPEKAILEGWEHGEPWPPVMKTDVHGHMHAAPLNVPVILRHESF